MNRRVTYPRPGSPLAPERTAGHARVRRACAGALGFVAVAGVAYLAFSFTAAWLAERIAS